MAMQPLFMDSFRLAHENFPEGGTCLEFGVYNGASYMYQVHEILTRYQNSQLIGFDSWQGLPAEEEGIWCPSCHAEGNFSAKRKDVKTLLRKVAPSSDERFRFVDGFFCDSLTDELREKISNVIFINIDVDIYKSTIELLDFVKPLLQVGTVMWWDDWGAPWINPGEPWGEHKAWADWSERNPEIETDTVEINQYNQRYMAVTKCMTAVLP